jgi:hypothetical protein
LNSLGSKDFAGIPRIIPLVLNALERDRWLKEGSNANQ